MLQKPAVPPHATGLFLIEVPLRKGGLVSGPATPDQARLVTELYSQGQASLVLAGPV